MTDITENDLDEEDAGPKPRVTDAPIEIWLQYGDELLVDTPHSTLSRDGEVSWCDSQVFPFDVKYVRSDEIDRLRARVAELEAADGECFTGMIVNIDGHDYGLRPGAARIVKEALADDPELDGTDFANPAWWRGEAYGSSAAIAAVTRILDGKDDGLGVANDEPWQSVRTRLREALRDAGRIGWIARMSKTSTVYMDNQHPWNVSGNYRFNNLRGQTFRDAIDAAMAKDGA